MRENCICPKEVAAVVTASTAFIKYNIHILYIHIYMAPYYRVMLHFKRLHCTVYTREVALPGREREQWQQPRPRWNTGKNPRPSNLTIVPHGVGCAGHSGELSPLLTFRSHLRAYMRAARVANNTDARAPGIQTRETRWMACKESHCMRTCGGVSQRFRCRVERITKGRTLENSRIRKMISRSSIFEMRCHLILIFLNMKIS